MRPSYMLHFDMHYDTEWKQYSIVQLLACSCIDTCLLNPVLILIHSLPY